MLNRKKLNEDIIEALDNGLQNDYTELLTMPPNEVLLDLMAYDQAVEEADPISDQHPDDLIPELMKTITDWQENRRTK